MQQVWDLSILDVAAKLDIKYGKSGNFRKCLCFMHADKNPSMWLKVSNNTWSCPVCNKGGGLVSLVREHEGLSFRDAVMWLARQFNIDAEEKQIRYGPRHKYNPPKTVQPMQTNQQPIRIDVEYVVRSRSTDTVFCRSLVSTGILTPEEMQSAACLYHLGTTRDDGVIFWYIDHLQQPHEGKVMWYKDDCHRDHNHNPTTISFRLKKAGLLTKDWKADVCLFGQHLVTDNERSIAVVESEKTAVICSQYMPEYVWLACGGLGRLTPEMFKPLKGHRIIVFPDTDPKGETHRQWSRICKDASLLIGRPIFVSNILERHSTEDQKQRKIDIADFLTENE